MGLNKKEKGRKTESEFNAKNYVKVNERIQEFREKHVTGLITTVRTEDDGGISFRAIVCRDKEEATLYGSTGIAAATGHSYLPHEVAGEKMEEYAETVSVGRALANLGIKVELGVASSDEMEQAKRVRGEDDDEKDSEDDDADAEDDEDDSREDDDEESDDEEDEPKLKSSRRFSGRKSSRFGG